MPLRIVVKRDGADVRGFLRPAIGAYRDGLEFDAKMGKVRLGFRSGRAAQCTLNQVAYPSLVPLQIWRQGPVHCRRDIGKMSAGQGAGPLQQFDFGTRRRDRDGPVSGVSRWRAHW